MIWAGIGLNAKLGPISFQNVGHERGHGVTAQRYIDQVIRSHVVPFFTQHQNHLFKKDSASSHFARATIGFLQHSIRVLQSPVLSPDLVPFKHVWNEVQIRQDEVRSAPTIADELRTAVLDMCRRISRASPGPLQIA
jgi:hypothetical protein